MSTFLAKYLVKNLIDDVTTLTPSTANNTANKEKLIDDNPVKKFSTSGQVSGTRSITWKPATTTAVTRIYVQNVNWEDFVIRREDSSPFSPALSFTGETASNFYFEVASQDISNANGINFIVTKARSEPAEMTVGQIYLGTEIYEHATDVGGNIIPVPDVSQRIVKLSDNTEKMLWIRDLLHFNLPLRNISVAEKANFRTVYDISRTNPIVFIWNPATPTDEWDGLAKHYIWANGWNFDRFTRDVNNSRFDGQIVLRQAGGF